MSGAPLASQPTISRFENGVSRTALYRIGRELAACVIERHRRRLHGRARRITIDPDRRPDARRPTAHVLQRALWRLVLSAVAPVSELRPRGGAVSVRGGAAAREGSGRRRDPRAAVSAAPAAAGGVSTGAVSRSARRIDADAPQPDEPPRVEPPGLFPPLTPPSRSAMVTSTHRSPTPHASPYFSLFLTSNYTEDPSIHPLFQEHLSERLHQRTNPVIGPIGKMVIQHPLLSHRLSNEGGLNLPCLVE